MKTRLIIITVIIFIHSGLNAQSNLVLNPGLESYYDTSEIGIASFRDGYVTNWSDPNDGTSDIFVPNSGGAYATPPSNAFGFEYPHSGFAYGGFIFYDSSILWHEYVQASFTSPLQTGKTYAIESYVSLGFDGLGICLSDLGFYFSDTLVIGLGGNQIPVIAQYENPSSNMINTQSGWQQITGTYMAHGGEQYLSIGLFKPYASAHLDFCNGAATYPSAYLFIDDVAVYDTAKVDTIHLCLNDSVQLGGIWRKTAGMYTDMIGGLPVKKIIQLHPYSVNLTIIDKPFLPGDSVRISLLQKGGIDSSSLTNNFIWASHDTTIDIPMFNIYGCDSTVRYRCGTNIGFANDIDKELKWNIYPNPTNDFLRIVLSNNNPFQYSISFIDITGKELFSKTLNSDTIDISLLTSGMYFVKLFNSKTGKLIGTEKFVIE